MPVLKAECDREGQIGAFRRSATLFRRVWEGNTPSLTMSAIAVAALATFLCADAARSSSFQVRSNPEPRIRYAITIRVAGAPGPFDRVEGAANYRVDTPFCVSLTPVSGATVVPQRQVRFALTPKGKAFIGAVFLDHFRDEDYFGRGVCHWSIVGLTADFHHRAVTFSPGIYKSDILAGRNVVKYFSKRSYNRSSDTRIDIGANHPSAYQDAQATFAVHMRATRK